MATERANGRTSSILEKRAAAPMAPAAIRELVADVPRDAPPTPPERPAHLTEDQKAYHREVLQNHKEARENLVVAESALLSWSKYLHKVYALDPSGRDLVTTDGHIVYGYLTEAPATPDAVIEMTAAELEALARASVAAEG